ncbi:MAG: carbonic anhydrase [Frankiales bacterium]|nr:carbonic anhydrase [Frankiales bacterium]
MIDSFTDVLEANRRFAQTYQSQGLAGRAARGLAIVTCMDSRIDPLTVLGLAKGDAKILRNAGARVTDDVLRTLVLGSHLLGVERVMILAHTDCRMTKVSDDQIHETMMQTAGLDTRSLDFGAITDQRAVLARDVQRIRSSPYLSPDLAIIGCVYDLDTGRIEVLAT